MTEKSIGPVALFIQRSMALMIGAIGVILLWLGAELAILGGSFYYIITAITLLAVGVLLWRGDIRGAWLYALMLVCTIIWAIWEVGLDAWALAPRIVAPAVLGLWLLTPWAFNSPTQNQGKRKRGGLAALIFAPFLVMVLAAIWPIGSSATNSASPVIAERSATGSADDWPYWGGDAGGVRYSRLAKINVGNVGELTQAWIFRTGAQRKAKITAFEVTPIKIDDTLYLCSPNNEVIALDAESGAVRWRFDPKTDLSKVFFSMCRGVSYFRDPRAKADAPCAERILAGALDGRLLALDARRGQLCPDFGNHGVVSLLDGLGKIERGYYQVTSAPQIVRGKVIVGGAINDNQHVGEPSGVIRAFDAVSGKFVWAFDMGRPDDHGWPAEGQNFTKGTPNSWAPISADETLGMVYLPTGNATPDWFGGHRRPFDDRYSSAVVALNAETGAEVWTFQTVHHDLWDYDVPSQPTLYDFPIGDQRIPALIQPTKRGEIFILDRRTGKPLTQVIERAVPRSTVPGERASPTQPFSIGMPSLAGPVLTERMMWGVTPIDQAWCRVAYHKARYEGTMTPFSVGQSTISYPGYLGGSDWGGIAIDAKRDIMIVNVSRVANIGMLIPRKQADSEGLRPMSEGVDGNPGGAAAMAGTPYGLHLLPFMSPLGAPCQQPPYGLIAAIDLRTRKLLWEKPFGTAQDSGPLGIRSGLPLTMGVPNTGGSVITAGGLAFIGAAQDGYFRAYDTRTGNILWQARLPAGGQATPMTYVSPKSGRQIVLIAAGGHDPLGTRTGDYIMAYALPRQAK